MKQRNNTPHLNTIVSFNKLNKDIALKYSAFHNAYYLCAGSRENKISERLAVYIVKTYKIGKPQPNSCTLTPTLIGMGIFLAVIAFVALTSFNCVCFTR